MNISTLIMIWKNFFSILYTCNDASDLIVTLIMSSRHRPLVYDDRRHDRLTYDPSTLNAR